MITMQALDEAITKSERMLRAWADAAPNEEVRQAYLLQLTFQRPFHTWVRTAMSELNDASEFLRCVSHALGAIAQTAVLNVEKVRQEEARHAIIGLFVESLGIEPVKVAGIRKMHS